MRILIDIAHPAHVHYFRNFAKIFEERGHNCLFTLRDKGIIVTLAKYYKLTYVIRSKERKHKIHYLLEAIKNVFIVSLKYKPDLFLDMGSVVSAPISKIFGKPYLAFDDTEVAKKARMLFMPFTDIIITPFSFFLDLGKKHIRLDFIMELFYLNKKYFSSNYELLYQYLRNDREFVFIRFVSWEAHHDVGHKGISLENKIKLVEYLSQKYEIYLSSEGPLSKELKKYCLNAPPHTIHHFLANAKYVIAEGATIASEAVVLGTAAIYVNTIQNGYSIEQNKYGLLISISDETNLFQAVEKVENLLDDKRKVNDYKNNHKKYLSNKIDGTSFLIWFVENYPKSVKIMKENPNYQYNFK